MIATKSETDKRCKYWRDDPEPERCRYFELHVLGGGKRNRGGKGGGRT